MQVFINKEELPPQEIPKVIGQIQKKKVLQNNGGFLLRIRFAEDGLRLGILPTLADGQRNKHYNIWLPEEPGNLYSGFLETDGGLSLVPTPPQDKPPQWEAGCLKEIPVIAEILLESGMDNKTPLAWMTQKILEELGHPEPGVKSLIGLKDLRSNN